MENIFVALLIKWKREKERYFECLSIDRNHGRVNNHETIGVRWKFSSHFLPADDEEYKSLVFKLGPHSSGERRSIQ